MAAAEVETTRRTVWERTVRTPLRDFLDTEQASAIVLLVAAGVALLWANVDSSGYGTFWDKTLSITLGDSGISMSLRGWVNSGLMTFFFFVVGLEARREWDLGELRERRRVTLPLLAGVAGMALPVLIYLAINAGHDSASGWGVAMSTDTALVLGMLGLIGSRCPIRLPAFLLTVLVVDDLVALIVIATVYTENVALRALAVAIGIFVVILLAHWAKITSGLVYGLLAVLLWVALFKSGVDPVVAGLGMGLLTYAYSATRDDLEQATDLFRRFREQPTPALARDVRAGIGSAISPNDRLQQILHPWTSFVIVPLFALANIGVVLSSELLSRAFTSPLTLGLIAGYVLGKPIGISGMAWIVTRVSGGRLQPPVGWAAVLGAGALSGVGFTVSVLIATLAFTGDQLDEAKVGVITAAVIASTLSWLVFRVVYLLPTATKIRLLAGSSTEILDLAVPVDPEGDHIRGPEDAAVTLLEYGDFECPFCGRAEPILREVLGELGSVRFVFRHLPLQHVHPRAQLAAEAAEAAEAQGKFWEMHDLLFQHQDALTPPDLLRYAEELGLDTERFQKSLRAHKYAARVAEDIDGADLSGVSGTPTFFINGKRHYGEYDVDTLSRAVRAAGARTLIG